MEPPLIKPTPIIIPHCHKVAAQICGNSNVTTKISQFNWVSSRKFHNDSNVTTKNFQYSWASLGQFRSDLKPNAKFLQSLLKTVKIKEEDLGDKELNELIEVKKATYPMAHISAV